MEQRVILPSDPEAARLETHQVWVDRLGRIYDTRLQEAERLARWGGATHVPCGDCGAPTPKGWLVCQVCREKRARVRYDALEKREWDGETPLTLYEGDEWFFSEEDIEVYCDTHGVEVGDLMLLWSKPEHAYPPDPYDLYVDLLPEDGDLPDGVQEAFDELAEKLNACKTPISWWPVDIAAVVG